MTTSSSKKFLYCSQIQSKTDRETKLRMYLGYLNNMSIFSSKLDKESSRTKSDIKSLSVQYSIWLKEVEEIIKGTVTANKKQRLQFLPFKIPELNRKESLIPQVKKISTSLCKEKLKEIVDNVIQNKKRLETKRVYHSLENSACPIPLKKSAMETIVEQASREEKEEVNSSITPTFASINTCASFTFAKEKKSFKDGLELKKLEIEGHPLENSSLLNISNENLTNNGIFSSFKGKESNKKLKIISSAAKLREMESKKLKSISEEVPPKEEKNIFFIKSMLENGGMKETEKSEKDIEYPITDNSDSSDEESEDESKPRAKWAQDQKGIRDRIREQNKNDIYLTVFGRCVIDHLNLAMIFERNDEQYAIRHSTADWRQDITSNTNKKNKNYSGANINALQFPY